MKDHSGFIRSLEAAIAQGLPGHDDFMAISGYKRPRIEAALKADKDPRESAVMVLLYPKAGQWHTLLMLRPDYDGVHGGQVSFPGGRREAQDADLQSTAVREFREETGVQALQLHFVTQLSRLYIPPSRSLVSPFLSVGGLTGPFVPDPVEVEELIEVPLSDLLRKDILKRTTRFVSSMGSSVEVPYFDVQGHVVWGATAMMVHELRGIIGRLGAL